MKKLVFTAICLCLYSASFAQAKIINEITVEIDKDFENEHLVVVSDEYFVVYTVSKNTEEGQKEWKFDFYNRNLKLEKSISYFFKPGGVYSALKAIKSVDNTIVCVFGCRSEEAIYIIDCDDFSTSEIPLKFEKGLTAYTNFLDENNIHNNYIVLEAYKDGLSNFLCYIDWKTGEYILSKPINFPDEKAKKINIDEILPVKNSHEIAVTVRMKNNYVLAIYKSPESEPEIYNVFDIDNRYRDEKVIKQGSNTYFVFAERFHHMGGARIDHFSAKLSDGEIIYSLHREFEDIFNQLKDENYNKIATQYKLNKTEIKDIKENGLAFEVVNAFSDGTNDIILTESYTSIITQFGQEFIHSHNGYCFLYFWIVDKNGNLLDVSTTPSFKTSKIFIEKNFNTNLSMTDSNKEYISLRYFNGNQLVRSSFNLKTHEFENINSSDKIDISIKPTMMNSIGRLTSLDYWYPDHVLGYEHMYTMTKSYYVIRLIRYE